MLVTKLHHEVVMNVYDNFSVYSNGMRYDYVLFYHVQSLQYSHLLSCEIHTLTWHSNFPNICTLSIKSLNYTQVKYKNFRKKGKTHQYNQFTKEREIRRSLKITEGYDCYKLCVKYIQEY